VTPPKTFDSTSATRTGLNLLALLGISIALWLGDSIFVPLIIAILLAAILWPVVRWLHDRLRIPWTIACMFAVGLLLSLFGIVTLAFVLSVPKMLQELPRPDRYDAQTKFYGDFRRQVIKTSPVDVNPVLPENAEDSQLFIQIRKTLQGEYVTNALLRIFRYFNSWLFQLVLITFILFFLLMEGRMLIRRVEQIFGPSKQTQDNVQNALAQMSESVRAYLVWRTIVNFGLGAVLGMVYYALGLKYSWTWAMLAAVLCYIPYIGTILAGVPPVLDAFVFVDPTTALIIVVFYTIVVTIEGYLIVPLVMGRSMNLNATTVLLACLFWDLVWGTPGLFLAMPLMAALKAVCMHVPGWRPWANLMGTDDGQTETEVTPPPDPEADKTVLMEAPSLKPKSGVRKVEKN
jgi:AI-2 transport protein TqsA